MMSTNTRCYLVCYAVMAAEVAIGAGTAYAAAANLGGWAAVVVVAAIGFGSVPGFEMGIAVGIATILACLLVQFHAPAAMAVPGGVAGLFLFFRSGPLLEWLYPPCGKPPEDG